MTAMQGAKKLPSIPGSVEVGLEFCSINQLHSTALPNFKEARGGRFQRLVTRGWKTSRTAGRSATRAQSPSPGSGEKYFSNFPSSPSNLAASAGGSRFWVMFGHTPAYSAFT